MADKGFVTKIDKTSSNCTLEKQTIQLKMGKSSEETLHTEDTQMANKHTKDAQHNFLRKYRLKQQNYIYINPV